MCRTNELWDRRIYSSGTWDIARVPDVGPTNLFVGNRAIARVPDEQARRSHSSLLPQLVGPTIKELFSQTAHLQVHRLGLLDYVPVWRAMQDFTDQRNEDTPDELWLVEHPPVFTQGQAGRAEHLLDPGDIPVIQVDRGGQVTYHGPGQIVAYPLVDIRRLGMNVRQLVNGIEQVIIDVASSYKVNAERLAGAPGVYVDNAKIAALGLRVRRGKSFHGLAFNINMDLEPFQRINPCGFEGLEVTNLSAFAEVSWAEVEDRLITGLSRFLGYNDRFRQAADRPHLLMDQAIGD